MIARVGIGVLVILLWPSTWQALCRNSAQNVTEPEQELSLGFQPYGSQFYRAFWPGSSQPLSLLLKPPRPLAYSPGLILQLNPCLLVLVPRSLFHLRESTDIFLALLDLIVSLLIQFSSSTYLENVFFG